MLSILNSLDSPKFSDVSKDFHVSKQILIVLNYFFKILGFSRKILFSEMVRV